MRLLSSIQTSLLASFLIALGGCASSVDITPSEPAPGPTPTPVPTTPVAKPPVTSLSCGLGDSKDPTRVVLAWARGAELVFTRADGTSFVAHTFPLASPDDADATLTIQLQTRGDFVAAIAASYSSDKLVSEALLIDRDGKVRWSETRNDEAFGVLFLGEGGALAVGSYSNLGSTIVAGPAGKIGEAMDQTPLSAPTKGGRVAVQHNFSVYATPTFGWLDPASGEVASFAYSTEQSYPVAVAGGVAYVAPDVDQGGMIFVSEGDSATGFTLPAESLGMGQATDNGFLVLQSQWGEPGSPQWLAQPGAAPAAITAPELTVFGGMYYEGSRAGDLGELIAPLRDEHMGGLYRSVDLGKTWSRLGPTFAEIADINYAQHGGTYVLQASIEAGYFPMSPWEPPVTGGAAPEQIGAANELVRPADGIARALPDTAQSFVLSEEGACLAYQDGGHLFAGAVASETTVDLGEMPVAWGSTVVWLR
jgi:hypothetical protein